MDKPNKIKQQLWLYMLRHYLTHKGGAHRSFKMLMAEHFVVPWKERRIKLCQEKSIRHYKGGIMFYNSGETTQYLVLQRHRQQHHVQYDGLHGVEYNQVCLHKHSYTV